jgi:DNA modification methylase
MIKHNDVIMLTGENSFTEQLKVKQRRRRAAIKRLAEPGAATRSLRNDPLPPLELVEMPVQELHSPDRKLRRSDAAHVAEVAGSISALGFSVPIIIDQNNAIVDGDTRLEAARQIGFESVPCVKIGHLTDAELRALRLAVNRLAEKGQWDLGELRVEFEELIVLDAQIEVTGFALDEIDAILTDDEVSSLEKGPLKPSPGALAVACLGDVCRMGPHRVICGNARDPVALASLFQGDPAARLVLTDQPFNLPRKQMTTGIHRAFVTAGGEMTDEQFAEFVRDWMKVSLGHLVEGGIFGTFIDWRGLPAIYEAAAQLGLAQKNFIVWNKSNPGNGGFYLSQHEVMPLFKKGDAPHVNNIKLGLKGRRRSNVWTYPGASTFGSDARTGLEDHPTVKPCAMLVDALLDLTNRGDIVLDPFLGSGSTLIAAERTGRRCRGVELDRPYVDVILRRYERETGRDAVLEETDETFREVAARRLGEHMAEDCAGRPLALASPDRGDD